MLCSICGANNLDRVRYCSSCGKEIIKNNQEVINRQRSSESLVDITKETREYYEAAIGHLKTKYYLTLFQMFDSDGVKASWNRSTFYLSFLWLLYRKMWVWALLYALFPVMIVFLILHVGLLLEESGSLFILFWFFIMSFYMLGMYIVFPMYANAIYYWHVNKKIQKAKKSFDDKDERLRMIAAGGGTSISITHIVILIAVFIGSGIIAEKVIL